MRKMLFYVSAISMGLTGATSGSAQIRERNQCEEAAAEVCYGYSEAMGYPDVATCIADQIQPACNDGGGRPPSIVQLPGGPVCVYWGSGPGRTGTGGC
jgi:hypothetical protein